MIRAVRHFLFVLIAFAIVGGTSRQLAQAAESAAPVTMAAMPCTMMVQTAIMQTADAGHGMPMLPCKGMDHDCIKLTGCIAAAALPARFGGGDLAATSTTVRYWSAMSKLGDRVSPPEPLPPRTI